MMLRPHAVHRNTIYDPETVTAYELSSKTGITNSMTVNANVFTMIINHTQTIKILKLLTLTEQSVS